MGFVSVLKIYWAVFFVLGDRQAGHHLVYRVYPLRLLFFLFMFIFMLIGMEFYAY